ncbi:hypothetical protein DKX38_000579 [Salix brachista]|uniref:Uncharacterized protein n=1 Tax=Salix brachista TaxID=2182728 RepID=A0A5N5P153_9ROSI|nr:hypothetical protein DKX38_000579 [Salix brachista]
MVTQEPQDPFKGVDWKAIGGELQKDPSAGTKPVIKKRLPKKIRQIPDYYFLPRLPLPTSIAFYGACIAGGVGAGMLLEMWINKKVKGREVRKKDPKNIQRKRDMKDVMLLDEAEESASSSSPLVPQSRGKSFSMIAFS